jgi:hypothetical protein
MRAFTIESLRNSPGSRLAQPALPKAAPVIGCIWGFHGYPGLVGCTFAWAHVTEDQTKADACMSTHYHLCRTTPSRDPTCARRPPWSRISYCEHSTPRRVNSRPLILYPVDPTAAKQTFPDAGRNSTHTAQHCVDTYTSRDTP